MTTWSKSTHLGMVNTLVNWVKLLRVHTLSGNFCHVLQFWYKHSKISQYKSSAEFHGTHFIFRSGISNLKRIWFKNASQTHFHNSPAPWKIATLPAVHAQTIAQNIGQPAQKLLPCSPSATLLFGGFKVAFKKFEFEVVKVGQMELGQSNGALDRTGRATRQLAYAVRPQHPDPPTEPWPPEARHHHPCALPEQTSLGTRSSVRGTQPAPWPGPTVPSAGNPRHMLPLLPSFEVKLPRPHCQACTYKNGPLLLPRACTHSPTHRHHELKLPLARVAGRPLQALPYDNLAPPESLVSLHRRLPYRNSRRGGRAAATSLSLHAKAISDYATTINRLVVSPIGTWCHLFSNPDRRSPPVSSPRRRSAWV
jgi:hypothetical protein